MKRHSMHSGSCSCTSCAYQSHSNRSSVQQLIQEGSRIDRLFYGKYLPLRERKLLERLIKTRAVYDDVRSQLLSTSGSSDQTRSEHKIRKKDDSAEKTKAVHKFVDLVDRGEFGSSHSSKLSSCCSCCSCSSFRKIKKHMEKHPPHVHRHQIPPEAIQEYVAEAEKKGRQRRKRLSTKISSKIRSVRFKVKQIRSEPCQCPVSITSMVTRSSKSLMKKIRPKHKTATDELDDVTVDSEEYITKDCTCPCNKVCKIPIKSFQKIKNLRRSSSIRSSGTEMGSHKKFRIKKDSLTLFREKLQKQKDFECEPGTCVEDECIPEQCLIKIKARGIGESKIRKHRNRISGPDRYRSRVSISTHSKQLKRSDSRTQTKIKFGLVDCECTPATKSVSSMTSIPRVTKLSRSRSKTIATGEKTTTKSQKAQKKKTRIKSKETVIDEKTVKISRHKAKTIISKASHETEPEQVAPEVKLGTVICDCKPATKSTSSMTSISKVKGQKQKPQKVITETHTLKSQVKNKSKPEYPKPKPTETRKFEESEKSLMTIEPATKSTSSMTITSKLKKSIASKPKRPVTSKVKKPVPLPAKPQLTAKETVILQKTPQEDRRKLKKSASKKVHGKDQIRQSDMSTGTVICECKPSTKSTASMTTVFESKSIHSVPATELKIKLPLTTKPKQQSIKEKAVKKGDKRPKVDKQALLKSVASSISTLKSSKTSKSRSGKKIKRSGTKKIHKAGRHKGRKEGEDYKPMESELKEEEEEEPGKQAVKISSSFKFEIEFSKKIHPPLTDEYDESSNVKRKKRDKGLQDKRQHHKKAQATRGKKYSQDSQISFLRETSSQTSKYTHDISHSYPKTCESSTCIHSKCHVDCNKLLSMSKYSERSAMIGTDRIRHKSAGSTTSSLMTRTRSKYIQSKSRDTYAPNVKESSEPQQPLEESHKQAVRISSSFTFNIEFSKDKSPGDDQDFSDMPQEHIEKVHKIRHKQKGTGSTKIKYDNTSSQSRSLQSMKNVQVGRKLKQCFCTLKLLQKKKQKVIHIRSKKTMADIHVHEKRAEIRGTQTKSSGIAYVIPPVTSLLPYECEPFFCTPGECNPKICLKRIKERNRSRETNTVNAPRRSILTLTSKSISTKKVQSDELKRKKQKLKHTQQAPPEVSPEKSGKQLVRIGSRCSFNVEFSKEKIAKDNMDQRHYIKENVDYSESQVPIKQERKRVQQKGIKVYKPRVRHMAADTARHVKTKETHTAPFLQRCFCTLKLFNKNKQETNKATLKNKNELMHIRNKAITANRAIITYHHMPRHSPYKCETYECDKRIQKIRDMKVLTDDIPIKSSLSETTKTFTTKSYGDPYIKQPRSIQKKIKENHTNNDNQQIPLSHSQQAVKIGSKFSFNLELYKEDLRGKDDKENVKSTYKHITRAHQSNEISNYTRSQQEKTRHENKIMSTGAVINDKGIHVNSFKRCLCTLQFHKKGKILKLQEKSNASTKKSFPLPNPQMCICHSTVNPYPLLPIKSQMDDCKSISAKRSIISNFYSPKLCPEKFSSRNHHIYTDSLKSESTVMTTNYSSRTRTKSTQSRLIKQSKQDDETNVIHRNERPNSSFSTTQKALHIGSNFSFNIEFYKPPSIEDPSYKRQTVKYNRTSDTTSVKKTKIKDVGDKPVPLKKHFSQASYNVKKQVKESNVSVLLKRYFYALAHQKKSITNTEKSNSKSVYDNHKKKNIKPQHTQKDHNNSNRIHIDKQNFFQLPYIQDLMKPRSQFHTKHQINTHPSFDERRKFKYNNYAATNFAHTNYFRNNDYIKSRLDCNINYGKNNDQVVTRNTSRQTYNQIDNNNVECLFNNTKKINPFHQSFYALNVKVSNYKYNKPAKKRVLDDNECEPGFCVPYECDPIECLKRIKSRYKSSKSSETDRLNTKSVTSTTTTKTSRNRTTKTKDRKYKQVQSFNNYSHSPQCEPDTHPSRHAVRVGSSFQFSVEFFKETQPHKSAFISRASQKFKKAKDATTRSLKGHFHHADSQCNIKCQSRAIGISPALKRCFCTLALKNKHFDEVKPVIKNKDESTMARKPFGHPVYNENRHVMTDKLKPYECAPNVCIPGECDPYECYKLIQERLKKYTETAVCTDKLKCRSASSLARKQKLIGSKTVQVKQKAYSTHTSNVPKKPPKPLKPPGKQTVKFGSNISFNLEFFKDTTNSFTSELTPPSAKSGNRIRRTHRRSAVSPPNNIRRKGSGDAQKKTRDQSLTCESKMEDRGNYVADMLNKCFCTLKLAKAGSKSVKNYKNELKDIKSKSCTLKSESKSTTGQHKSILKSRECAPDCKLRKNQNISKGPRVKPSVKDKGTSTKEKRIPKNFKLESDVTQTKKTKGEVKLKPKVENKQNFETKRKKSLLEKCLCILTPSKTKSYSNSSDSAPCIYCEPILQDSAVKAFIQKCKCTIKHSKKGKKLSPKPSKETIVDAKTKNKSQPSSKSSKPAIKLEKKRVRKTKPMKQEIETKLTNHEMETILPYSKKKFKNPESKTKLIQEQEIVSKEIKTKEKNKKKSHPKKPLKDESNACSSDCQGMTDTKYKKPNVIETVQICLCSQNQKQPIKTQLNKKQIKKGKEKGDHGDPCAACKCSDSAAKTKAKKDRPKKERKKKVKKSRRKPRDLCPECQAAIDKLLGENISVPSSLQTKDRGEPCSACRELKLQKNKAKKKSKKSKKTKDSSTHIEEKDTESLDVCQECKSASLPEVPLPLALTSKDICPICSGLLSAHKPGYEHIKLCTCCKSVCNSFVDKLKTMLYGEIVKTPEHEPEPFFDLFVNQKDMNILNTEEVFRNVKPKAKIFKAAERAQEEAEESEEDEPPPIDVFIDRNTGNIVNVDEILRNILPYEQWVKIRREYYKAARKHGPITCKTLRAWRAQIKKPEEDTIDRHSDTCSCCICKGKRKKKGVDKKKKKRKGKAGSGKGGSGKAESGKAGSEKAESGKAGSGKAGSSKAGSGKAGSGKAGSDKTDSSKPGSVDTKSKGSKPGSSITSTGRRKKPGTPLRRKKFKPCICGSLICKHDWERLKREAKAVKLKKVKKCTCGTDICAVEAAKVPIKLERASRELRRKKEKAIMRANAERRYQRERLMRKKRYAIEDAERWRRRKLQDKRDMRQVKKQASKTPDLFKVSESILDFTKFQVKAGSDIIRCICRYLRHPRDAYYNVKEIMQKPEIGAEELIQGCEGTGFMATLARIKHRITSMVVTQKTVKAMESYPITNFMLHALDKDPTKRMKKFKKQKEITDFECNLYMASLRKRPCMWVYRMCPWFYPHCMSLLTALKQFIDVTLFILAVGVWSPCILCMELCRAMMCCFLCTE